LQKLLGKNYKWLYLFLWSYRQSTAYRASTFSWILSKFFVLGFTILIWKLNIDSGSTLFKFSELFTYYILGGFFSFPVGVNFNLANSIKSGYLTTRLLRPCSAINQVIFNDFGWNIFRHLVECTILSLVLIFGWQYFVFTGWLNLVLTIGFFAIAYLIMNNLGLIFGTLAFWVVDTFGLMDFLFSSYFYLSGKAIPLNLISSFLTLTPFAFLYFVPMQVYFEKYSNSQLWTVFGIGIFWLIFSSWLARFVFKLGLKKNEAVGL
jgi:ABC-2 type transport system permease protein